MALCSYFDVTPFSVHLSTVLSHLFCIFSGGLFFLCFSDGGRQSSSSWTLFFLTFRVNLLPVADFFFLQQQRQELVDCNLLQAKSHVIPMTIAPGIVCSSLSPAKASWTIKTSVHLPSLSYMSTAR